jgi:hypothetical protein
VEGEQAIEEAAARRAQGRLDRVARIVLQHLSGHQSEATRDQSGQQSPPERAEPQLGTVLAGGEGERQGRSCLCWAIMPVRCSERIPAGQRPCRPKATRGRLVGPTPFGLSW